MLVLTRAAVLQKDDCVWDPRNKHFDDQNRISSVLKKCIVVQRHVKYSVHKMCTRYHFRIDIYMRLLTVLFEVFLKRHTLHCI